jgi:hypothetical protein
MFAISSPIGPQWANPQKFTAPEATAAGAVLQEIRSPIQALLPTAMAAEFRKMKPTGGTWRWVREVLEIRVVNPRSHFRRQWAFQDNGGRDNRTPAKHVSGNGTSSCDRL